MGNEQIKSLSYSVRPRVVLKYLGQLLLGLSALTAVTLAASLLAGDYGLSIRYSAVVSLLAASGAFMGRLRVPPGMKANEALAITALVFAVTPLVMTYPMMASGLPFMDALFEAVSGITTTGLSTTATVEDKSATFLFARAWLQWSGGLGIVILSVALLIGPGVAARRLTFTEAEAADVVSGTRAHARRVLGVYVALTATGVVIVRLAGADTFPALVHTLSAVSTGGYSSYDDSLAGFGRWQIQAAVVSMSLMGAIPLSLYYRAYRQGKAEFFRDKEFHALLVLSLAVAGLLTLFMGFLREMPWSDALRQGPIMAFSAQTTAGFSTLPVSELSNASKLILIISMVVGGNAGSTAGGMKILRLLIMLRIMHMAIIRTFMPGHVVAEPKLGKDRLAGAEIERSLIIILLFAVVIVLSWVPFVVMGYEPLDALFEVASATGTVGLSTGITGPELPYFLKGVLCLDMLMGRLEIVAVLILLYPKTWFGRRVSA